MVGLLLSLTMAYAEQPAIQDQKTAINAVIAARQHPYLTRADFQYRAEDLDALYKLSGYQLFWLGKPDAEKNVTAVLDLLAVADSHGLNPADYDVAMLRQRMPAVLQLKPDAYKELGDYDLGLSLSLLRFLHDLHYGRVYPQQLGFNLKLRVGQPLALPELINKALAEGTLVQLPAQVEIPSKQYQKLKQILATYRQLAATGQSFQFEIKDTLRPGDAYPQLAGLRQFLTLVGDLPNDQMQAAETGTIYTEAIAVGVKNFQKRHGLAADGHIGKSTSVALSVPLAQRVQQIELAMERLRWLPTISAGAQIIVNIPAFQLWAFEDIARPDADMISMRVVVGNAQKTKTPVLMADMQFIDFMPYWNVPYSIIKNEILPKLLRSSDYLDRENMETVSVSRSGESSGLTADTMMMLKEGRLRVRQRPGGRNALGKVKFLFPNKDDVYMHDTPSVGLFGRARRDFSHGCVRVAEPQKLAEFALKNQSGWGAEAIKRAMSAPKSQWVTLKKPIPVLFFYTTTYLNHSDKLEFYADIYGHDAVLLEALHKPIDLSDRLLFTDPPQNTEATVASSSEQPVQ